MKNRGGQITIFIIITILVIAGVALFFTMKGTLHKETTIDPEIAPLVNFIQSCLDNSLEDVIYEVGQGGGYYFPPSLSTKDLGLTYYEINNKSYMPSKSKIESEISRYTIRSFVNCTNNFKDFSQYDIQIGQISPHTTIFKDSVELNLDYSLTIVKGDKKFRINHFDSKFYVSLGNIYDAVYDYLDQELTFSQGSLCTSCVLNITNEYGLYSNSILTDEGVIFVMVDKESYDSDPEGTFKYVFVNKY